MILETYMLGQKAAAEKIAMEKVAIARWRQHVMEQTLQRFPNPRKFFENYQKQLDEFKETLPTGIDPLAMRQKLLARFQPPKPAYVPPAPKIKLPEPVVPEISLPVAKVPSLAQKPEDPRHAKIRELLEAGNTLTEVGKQVGVSLPTVAYLTKKYNLIPEGYVLNRGPRSSLHQHKEEIQKMLSEGTTLKQIASHFNMSGPTVGDFVRNHMPEVSLKELRVRRSPRSALEGAEEKIRELLSKGVPLKDVSAQFGVHPATVSKFKTENLPDVVMKRGRRAKLENTKEELLQLIREGKTTKEIADQMGVDKTTLRVFLRRNMPEVGKPRRAAWGSQKTPASAAGAQAPRNGDSFKSNFKAPQVGIPTSIMDDENLVLRIIDQTATKTVDQIAKSEGITPEEVKFIIMKLNGKL